MAVKERRGKEYISPETCVLNTRTLEEGTVLNGYELTNEKWTAYEVSTPFGIKVWDTEDILIRR